MKLALGFITYENLTAKYLPYFLPSLEKALKYSGLKEDEIKILAIDNSIKKENDNKFFINKNYAKIDFKQVGQNLGFARAYNKMIKRAVELKVKYFLMLNPDTILEPDAILEMIKVLEKDGSLSSVCPKILRWNFEENKKTKIIDSCGLILKPGLRFFNLGEAQLDQGQFDQQKILGPSGTAALFKIKALEKEKNYFDENMFMYKEDCDLAYRLFLTGWKSKLASKAIVYHDRSGVGAGESDFAVAFNRRKKSRFVKINSFLNQHIIFIKFWHLQNFWSKINIIFYASKIFIFSLIFEQYLLKSYLEIFRMRNKIKKINCKIL